MTTTPTITIVTTSTNTTATTPGKQLQLRQRQRRRQPSHKNTNAPASESAMWICQSRKLRERVDRHIEIESETEREIERDAATYVLFDNFSLNIRLITVWELSQPSGEPISGVDTCFNQAISCDLFTGYDQFTYATRPFGTSQALIARSIYAITIWNWDSPSSFHNMPRRMLTSPRAMWFSV